MDETMKQIQYVASHSILLFGTLQMAIELRGFLSMQEIGHNLTISDFVPVMKERMNMNGMQDGIRSTTIFRMDL